jgi:hypothetical protein
VQLSAPRRPVFGFWLVIFLVSFGSVAIAQSTGSIQGAIHDPSGASIAHAQIGITGVETGLVRRSESDVAGTYVVPSLPPGHYTVTVDAQGMMEAREQNVLISVDRDVPLNFSMKLATTNSSVDVHAGEQTSLDLTSSSQSQTLSPKVVQEAPLNGRHFIDLFPLVAGTVTPPQNGSLSAPTRGTGASGFNSAGYREDMTNLMINGITHTDLQQNQIAFQPTINIVSEFKVINSVPSAEFGRSSGVMVNVATRTGTNAFHGEAYEFLRNNAFDARNFFNPTPVAQSPFKRNQFGGDLGGPLWKNHTFLFLTYEGLRQRQGVTINSGVLTAAQRTSSDPTVQQLIALIPQANNATGTAFIGSAGAPVNINQWSANLSHNFSPSDSTNGFYVFQTDKRNEPTLQGDTVPGFGDQRYFRRQFIAINETHIFSPSVVNEARFGISRLRPNYLPAFQANPVSYGINDGITLPIGLPQITITSIALTIGGPSAYPQYRGDTTAVLSDTLSILKGKNYIKTGGEYRRFISSNETGNTGSFTFSSPATFLADQANAFKVTEGFPSARIFVNALNGFVQDSYKWSSRVTLEGGVRVEWNGTPTEGENRFVAFDPTTTQLVHVGSGSYGSLYGQNWHVEPRVGFIIDPMGTGKFLLRGGYAIEAEQPITNPLIQLSANPPYANPLNFTSSVATPSVSFENAANVAGASTLAPSTVPHNFKDAYVQNYNLNLQFALNRTTTAQVGYYGLTSRHLRLTRNINQPVNGVKPFAAVSANSSIAAGRTLGNITDYDSDGMSNYNSLWLIVTKQMGHGLQLNSSYVWGKALDLNSLSTQGVILPDSYNPSTNYGASDFDVRHRFVLSGVYALPVHGNVLVSGWQLSGIVQLQTGNPFSVTTNQGTNGTAGTIRANVVGPVSTERTFLTNGSVQYVPQSICYAPTAGCTFSIPTGLNSTQARNSIFGPGFENTDVSLSKFFTVYREGKLQFRADAFNLLNHPNLGQPSLQIATSGTTVTPGTFGQISSTRFPTGDSGSSRQLQLSLKLLF